MSSLCIQNPEIRGQKPDWKIRDKDEFIHLKTRRQELYS